MDVDKLTDLVSEVVTGGLGKWLEKIPLGASSDVAGELLGDSVRLWRVRNLVRILKKLEEIAELRGIDQDQMGVLAAHVGLPWIDKASYSDDDNLQERWAELFLSLFSEDDTEYNAGVTYMRILEQLDPWDCKLLDYVVEIGGVSATRVKQLRVWRELIRDERLVSSEEDRVKVQSSIEKLIRCGCLNVQDVSVSHMDFSISLYGDIERFVWLTTTGLNFHSAVSGRRPDWLNRMDSEL